MSTCIVGPALIGNFGTQTFREALGKYVTGVAIVTTCDEFAQPVGITINSFSSVSLDPPLIGWSLRRNSMRAATFERAGYYAVNVLAADQQALSARFARQSNPFEDLDWHASKVGCPLLAGCCAQFVVRNLQRYPGGDHLIYLGEVIELNSTRREPLLFYAGRYYGLNTDTP